jgi:5,10-methylenetetrahydromethanopterin reductase
MSMNRLGLSFSWREKSLADIVSCCQIAEEARLDSVWIPEAWGRDAFLTLAAIANATQNIKLATGIVNVYSRSPAAIAMSTATLEELSHGRAILGLGSSGSAVIERWHGLHFQEPLTRLRESVTIIQQILSGTQVNHQGELFRVGDFRLATQAPARNVPIYIATLGPKMLRLSGEVADGALLYLCSPSRVRDAIAQIHEGAVHAERSSASVDIAAFLPTYVSENVDRARLTVARAIAYYVGGMGAYYHRMVSRSGFKAEADNIRAAWQRGDRAAATKQVTQHLIDSMSLVGSAAECRARLEDFRKAGVTLPILSFSISDEEGKQSVSDSIKALAGN